MFTEELEYYGSGFSAAPPPPTKILVQCTGSTISPVRWDYMVKRDDYSINLYPSPKQISKVLNNSHKKINKCFNVL